MVNKIIIVIFLTTFFVSSYCARRNKDSRGGKVVICYLQPVELYGEPLYKVDVKELSLCTHLVLEITTTWLENSTVTIDPLLHIGGNREERINEDFISGIRKNHPHIKITLGIYIFFYEFKTEEPALPQNQTTRQMFIRSIVDRIRELRLNGLDIYIWNLPANANDTNSLRSFIRELKEVFLQYDYILTAAFTGLSKLVDFTSELAKLSSYLDLLSIATIDTNLAPRRLERTVIPVRSENESDDNSTRSVEFIIKYLLEHGVKPNKLVLMSFLHGSNYLLSDPEVEEIQDEDIIPINIDGLLSYRNICSELTTGEKPWIPDWYEKFTVPYIRVNKFIIFYENPKSIVSKIKLAVDYNLKGVAIWGMQYDDYLGECDLPNDTYVEFIERFNKFKDDPNLLEKLKDLKLPNVSTTGDFYGKSYGVFDNTLCFQTPEVKTGPYPMLRTINQAITLSLEEKKILDALKVKKPPKHYCLFWPICAAPINPPKSTTNSAPTT